MADTYSDTGGLILMEEGGSSNDWGDLANLNFDRIDFMTRGYKKITLAGAETLDHNDITTTSSVAREEGLARFIEFAGTAGTVTVPAENIVWLVYNNTGSNFTFQPSGGTGVTLYDGKFHIIVYGSSGTTFVDVTSRLYSTDDTFEIRDDSDPTKVVKFQVSGVTTATTRTLTIQDASDTLVGRATTDTLTNKTLGDSNTINAQTDAFTIDDSADATKQVDVDVAGATTSTKTTLDFNQTANRTITIPDATDTLVGKATTDTLTNKTIGDSADSTKTVGFDIAGATTSTKTTLDFNQTANRTITFPDATDTVAAVGTSQTFTAGQRGEITTLTDGATITPDMDDSNNFTVTLGGNRTLANPSNLTAGQSGSIFVVQDGTGSRTLSFGSYWDFAGGTAPTLSTTASAVDRIDYVVRSTTSIHAVATLALS